jgi:hypothetical protein
MLTEAYVTHGDKLSANLLAYRMVQTLRRVTGKPDLRGLGGVAMVRDGVANIVQALRERGFDPRRAGTELWESRCPVHRSTDYAFHQSRRVRPRGAQVPEREELPV